MSNELIEGAELNRILGANGVEQAPWWSKRLGERIDAELMRLMAIHGAQLGDYILNVVTPDAELTEAWLSGQERQIRGAYADSIRKYGRDDAGLVWPGVRRLLADAYRVPSPPLSKMLEQTPGPYQLLLVVHYRREDGAAVAAVVPYVALVFKPDAGATS